MIQEEKKQRRGKRRSKPGKTRPFTDIHKPLDIFPDLISGIECAKPPEMPLRVYQVLLLRAMGWGYPDLSTFCGYSASSLEGACNRYDPGNSINLSSEGKRNLFVSLIEAKVHILIISISASEILEMAPSTRMVCAKRLLDLQSMISQGIEQPAKSKEPIPDLGKALAALDALEPEDTLVQFPG